jgi:septal ring factor EnvC (AmiA/AmiB activator)
MAANLEEQSRLARIAADQLSTINESKDELLRKRLSVRRSIRSTETNITSLEKELQNILGVIKALNYKLKTQRTKHFADNRKLLPWPAKGKIASTFSPWSKPARRGIGLQTAANAEVKSVFWGKVVHADIMRGFGQVVIVYHGHDYYSVYAYLSRALVEPGQEVEKDEPIGTAGFDPRTKKPGLYFELRLGSKPINPVKWLFPK